MISHCRQQESLWHYDTNTFSCMTARYFARESFHGAEKRDFLIPRQIDILGSGKKRSSGLD
jgi:hypothetical protein